MGELYRSSSYSFVPGTTLKGEVLPFEPRLDFRGLLFFRILGERERELLETGLWLLWEWAEKIDYPPRPSVFFESFETIESRTFNILKVFEFLLPGVLIFYTGVFILLTGVKTFFFGVVIYPLTVFGGIPAKNYGDTDPVGDLGEAEPSDLSWA